MATPYILNNVREEAGVTGLTDIQLLGAGNFKSPFSNYLNDQDTVLYYVDDMQGNWESGVGTYNTIPNTLTRTRVISSSNFDDYVNFGGGTKYVSSDLDAKIIQQLLELIPYPFW